MKKRVSVKKILLFLLLFLLLAVTGMLVWIFFLPKKYTVMYHMSGNRTIESAEVILYGRQESGEYGYSMYLLEDKDNLEKIEKALSGMKMYPCHITKLSDITEATAEDRKWLLHLNGKNDTYFSIGMIGTDRKGQSIINQSLMNNGVGTKYYLDIIGNVVAAKFDFLLYLLMLYQLLSDLLLLMHLLYWHLVHYLLPLHLVIYSLSHFLSCLIPCVLFLRYLSDLMQKS